jgi:hypothetical protein
MLKKILINCVMISCLIYSPIGMTSECDKVLSKCTKVVEAQEKTINSQKKVIIAQDTKIRVVEDRVKEVEEEAKASKALNWTSVLTILLFILL